MEYKNNIAVLALAGADGNSGKETVYLFHYKKYIKMAWTYQEG